MTQTMKPIIGALVLLALVAPVAAWAQAPPLPDMNLIARALGVSCEYCHARGIEPTEPVAIAARRRLDIAKAMIEMTAGLNTSVAAATNRTEKAPAVQCITCHRGVAIPRQLSEIVLQTTMASGGAAAADQYRELRQRYYGRQSYDFGEDELLRAVERIVSARPADAIALLTMNLEFYPQSSSSYVLIGQAYIRMRDLDAAIRSFEKAIELDPNNAMARGRLVQLLDDRDRSRR
jgi:tetratricopeptide (TPR) repeat protein